VLTSPKSLGTAAGILLALGLVPGLPHLAFLTFGSAVAWLAHDMRRREQQAAAGPKIEPAPPKAKTEEPIANVVPLDLMEVQVGYGLISLVEGQQGGSLLDRIKGLRRQFAESMGFVIPPIHIRDNLQLRPNEYAIMLKGVELTKSEILPSHVLAIDPGTAQRGAVQGIATKEPAFGLPALWVPDAARDQAQMAGYTVVDASSAIATHLSEVIKRHAYELVGRQEVQSLLDEMAKVHPKLVEELIPTVLSLGSIVRILANLLKEGVPIRDLRTILEAVADHAQLTKDTDLLTEAARQALARTITKQYVGTDGTLAIINLDPKLDRTLADHAGPVQNASATTLDPGLPQQVVLALKQAAERVASRGYQPVILCSATSRRYLRKLTDRVLHSVPILGMNEVDSAAKLQAIETVRLEVSSV
jgi:flagellar biosynthesis protein FlhA